MRGFHMANKPEWIDILKLINRPRPVGPQPLTREPSPHVERTRSKSKTKFKTSDLTKPDDKVETDVAPQTKDECVCRNPLCNMRATWKCRNCQHQSCDIHKEILESFTSPTNGQRAKDVHNFGPWDCKSGEEKRSRDEVQD